MTVDAAPTFASFLTPPGMLVAAGLITTLIAVLKSAIPVFAAANGATLSFVFSALLYVVTAVALRPGNPDGYLLVFTAWVTVAAGAIGIKNVGGQVQQARSTEAITPEGGT